MTAAERFEKVLKLRSRDGSEKLFFDWTVTDEINLLLGGLSFEELYDQAEDEWREANPFWDEPPCSMPDESRSDREVYAAYNF